VELNPGTERPTPRLGHFDIKRNFDVHMHLVVTWARRLRYTVRCGSTQEASFRAAVFVGDERMRRFAGQK
jgi:hypothetical protein